MMSKRLLILMCSDRKRGVTESLPALDRYDGPLWQVLRAYQREQPLLATELDIYVLSAAFGLIPATQEIPWYDQKMTPARANELQPDTLASFPTLMSEGYEQICFGMSQVYLSALKGWEQVVPNQTAVTIADGPIGTKKGQVRAWLEGRVWQQAVPPERLTADTSPRGEAVVAGVRLQMTHDEVLQAARTALAADEAGAARFRDWYVLVDERRVAPKWLVSQLTGKSVKDFDAGAARRTLLALGLDVIRDEQQVARSKQHALRHNFD